MVASSYYLSSTPSPSPPSAGMSTANSPPSLTAARESSPPAHEPRHDLIHNRADDEISRALRRLHREREPSRNEQVDAHRRLAHDLAPPRPRVTPIAPPDAIHGVDLEHVVDRPHEPAAEYLRGGVERRQLELKGVAVGR
eukprot:31320-Pelagococcus_subviridis.AAC.5